MHDKGEKPEGFDAVIPRIGASVTFYGTAVQRQFEMMGVFPLNESVAITRSRDTLRSLQLLSRKGIGLPVTGFAHKPDDIQELIKIVGGAPLVIKLLEGTQGIGVVLAATHRAAESVIEAFMGLHANILAQEFTKGARCGLALLRDRRQGGGRDEASGYGGRVSLEPAPRRLGKRGADHPGGALHGRAPRPDHGVERRWRRPAPFQPWLSGGGGQLVAGTGRGRAQRGARPNGHWANEDSGQGLRMRSPFVIQGQAVAAGHRAVIDCALPKRAGS